MKEDSMPNYGFLSRDKWEMSAQDAIGDQLARVGIPEYVELGGDYEGNLLPSGSEENSGIESISMIFLAPNGNIYDVWLGWNPDKTAPDGSRGYYELYSYDHALSRRVVWTRGEPLPTPKESSESKETPGSVVQARKLLGLPVTEKQEKALRDFLIAHPHYLDRHYMDKAGLRSMEKTITVLNQPPAKSDS